MTPESLVQALAFALGQVRSVALLEQIRDAALFLTQHAPHHLGGMRRKHKLDGERRHSLMKPLGLEPGCTQSFQ